MDRDSLKYHHIYNNINDAIFIHDLEGNILEVNRIATLMLGYTEEEFCQRKISDISMNPSDGHVGVVMQELHTRGSAIFETVDKHRDGHPVFVEISSTLFDYCGKQCVLSVTRDITPRKNMEKELEKTENKYRKLFEKAHDLILVIDAETDRVIDANEKACLIFGYTKEEFLSLSIPDIQAPEYRGEKGETIRKELDLYQGKIFESVDIKKNGERIDVEVSIAPIEMEEENIYLNIIRDITLRKETERKLQQAVRRSGFLMKELNHRVKNNLILISSLVMLKDETLGDSVDLSDISRQIDTISLIHEKMYQAESDENIDIEEYLFDLATTIFSFSDRKVEIRTEIEAGILPTKQIVTLGLIINELATNSLKHGFETVGNPQFNISLKEDALQGEYLLTVSNNGKAFPDDIGLDNPSSLGLKLISELAAQLKGSISLQRRPHPSFTVRFPSKSE